ncbi:MAG: cytochrome c [Oxalobacteraceae bacterium]
MNSPGKTTQNPEMVILEGVQRQGDIPEMRMQSFAKMLSDQQIATLGSYLTQHYGNPAAKVTAQQVKNLRDGGATSNVIWLARGAMITGVLLIAAFFVFRLRKRNR